MPTRIKNCGLTTAESVACALSSGAHFLGFVHHRASPRHLTLDAMAPLVAQARGRAKTVAVLVTPEDDLLTALMHTVKPDYLQLHHMGDAARIAHIQSKFGLPIITALALRHESDLTHLAAFEEISDYLLFDAPSPGSGKTFDWRLLKHLPLKKKWFLAGGLTAENVGEAIAITHAPMVDVSSGIEDPPGSGHKLLAKIVAFNDAARRGVAGDK